MWPKLLLVASVIQVLMGGPSQAKVCHQAMTGLLQDYSRNTLAIVHIGLTSKTPSDLLSTVITGHYHCKNLGKETDGCLLTGPSAILRGRFHLDPVSQVEQVELELNGKSPASPQCTSRALVIEQSLCIGGMHGSFSCGDGRRR